MWDVAIFDIPGAYFNADMLDEKYAWIGFGAEFLDIMCDVNTDHIQNIRYKH